MVDWYGRAGSNNFQVKSVDAFLAWAERRRLEVFKSERGVDVFAIHPGESTDSDGWLSYHMETEIELNLASEFSTHLCPGQIAVLSAVGAERLRYLTGNAIAMVITARWSTSHSTRSIGGQPADSGS